MTALPLFPDLLEQSDPMKRWVDYERRGHAVWCIDDLGYRTVNEDCSDLTCLAVIYDTERWLHADYRTGKHWIVEIKHHLYEYVMVETGWGSSRKKERKLRYRARIHEKRFSTREEACQFAEKIQAIFQRMKARRDELDEPEPIEDEPEDEQPDDVDDISSISGGCGADEIDAADNPPAGVHADRRDSGGSGEA